MDILYCLRAHKLNTDVAARECALCSLLRIKRYLDTNYEAIAVN